MKHGWHAALGALLLFSAAGSVGRMAAEDNGWFDESELVEHE